MNDVEMMHIVVMALMAFVAGAELTRNGMVLPIVAHQLYMVYSLFTGVRNLFVKKTTAVEGNKTRIGNHWLFWRKGNHHPRITRIPTWYELVTQHGYEKVLLADLNSWRNGVDPQTYARNIPAKVMSWIAHWSSAENSRVEGGVPVWDFAAELRAEDEAMEADAIAAEEESYDREEKRINQMGRLGLTNGDEEGCGSPTHSNCECEEGDFDLFAI